MLKIEIPATATKQTNWKTTFLDKNSLYLSSAIGRKDLAKPGGLRFRIREDIEVFEPGSDAHAVFIEGIVAVTPLSLDLTSRVDLQDIQRIIESKQ